MRPRRSGCAVISPHSRGPPRGRPNWLARLGPLGPFVLVILKGKGLLFAIFKFKFLFSLFSFVAVYWALYGWKFGIGFAVSILIHEMGHYIDIKRRGLPAEMPVFLPGLGAYVRWQALGVTLAQRAQISLRRGRSRDGSPLRPARCSITRPTRCYGPAWRAPALPSTC